ncbi:MAG TPA: EAL domain-containing protein [Nevskia sp.]|jgi:EAL domain-containing protein (putative c-di-GMP-specific phosphodiesterase class I)|nr:EAL domain-containing protein [Nevskia sp.]
MDRFKQRLAAGETLFEQGDEGSCAYIVESGAIEILHGAGARIVARLGAGEIFGEMALLGQRSRSAAARAAEDTVLVRVTEEYLGERVQAADPMVRHLLRTLTRRSRQLLDGKSAPATADADSTLAHDHLLAEQELTLGLERGELLLYLQPIVLLGDGGIAGFEALVRWQHPQRGMVPPGQFIPLAEESVLINRIGLWMIDAACAALARLNELNPARQLFMSINLSGRQLNDPAVLPAVEAALARHAVAPQQIKLEITESLLLQNLDEGLPLLRACRERGLRISLDDFGTGYSSLAYLHRLPIDTLKLDRSFVLQLDSNEAGRRIVAAVIRLAHELEMDVITEGLETKEQIDALKDLGSDLGQGYWFGRPAALPAALEIVRKSL